MRVISRWLVNFILLLAFSTIFPASFYIGSWQVALGAAAVLTLLQVLIKPILSILFLPINIVTFGLFNLVLNALILEITAILVGPMMSFSSFGMVFVISLLMSICNYFITPDV
ncbi:phage holin family protein [Fructilactobacillus cliffordii]|uniref:Phage holin family protein n=1 Tax=Fructilactobacillus cliffordii TaxID=2940299 RepID=A0A9Q9DZZ8_9LACO|nr:phage holin family protein [Fructilactobacillus cliffordii]USS86962.1 phage holin family protein [Fructilactobacillus cliffordii]USS88686.1 phage holin family protein [Fructilactobacillus cliffordii]